MHRPRWYRRLACWLGLHTWNATSADWLGNRLLRSRYKCPHCGRGKVTNA